MNDVVKVPLKDLVFKEDLYPRPHVDPIHIRELEHAMEGGSVLPPITVAQGSNIIVDGAHRVRAHQNQGRTEITAIIKAYKDDAELWRDAIALNAGVGLKLGVKDQLRILDISARLGVEETELSKLLKTSLEHLRKIKPRYATVQDAMDDVGKLRRIPLKGSTRHLSGETISSEQAAAIGRAPGPSYLLAINQLLDALEYNLLPPPDSHPALWAKLQDLAQVIIEKLGEQKKETA
jgi:ParB-like chromosome segregation protein Spo0J